jgi:enoyl-CoA hydratase
MSQNISCDDLAPGVRRITLNRPDSLNALLHSMYVELLDIFAKIALDPSVRVVVLTGAGKGFCSGQDGVNPEPKSWVPPNVGKSHYALYYMSTLSAVVAAIRNLPQPVIAAVNGTAAGMGYTLAIACDMAIAAKSAKFVNAFHNAGTGSEGGLSYLLPRVVGTQRAAELLLTARPVLAEEAERIGLVLRSVPDEQLMSTVLEVAEAIQANAPLDTWLTKQNLNQNLHAGSFEQAIAFETRASAMASTTEDAQEKRLSRREKRAPVFRNL